MTVTWNAFCCVNRAFVVCIQKMADSGYDEQAQSAVCSYIASAESWILPSLMSPSTRIAIQVMNSFVLLHSRRPYAYYAVQVAFLWRYAAVSFWN